MSNENEPSEEAADLEEQLRIKAEQEKRINERAAEEIRRKRRGQLAIALIGLAGILFSVHYVKQQQKGAGEILTEQSLTGTWELVTVNNLPVGDTEKSTIVKQIVKFNDGKVIGETRLRANTDASTTAMPFPDETVEKVSTAPDNNDVIVIWQGTYKMNLENGIDFRVGKARYRCLVKRDPASSALLFDHDTILTFPGGARYQQVHDPVPQTARQ